MPSGRSLSLLSSGSRLPFWCGDVDRMDYWVEVKHRYRLPKPYCWEIYRADRLQAVQQSMISYKTEAMARIDGERALRQMLEELDTRPSEMPSVPIQVRKREQ